MYLEDFKEIVEKLDSDVKEENSYFDSLFKSKEPAIYEFVEQNQFSKIMIRQNNFLLSKLFENDQELYDWMNWYLYDRHPINSQVTGKNGVEYSINSLESFMVFVKQELNLKMKSKISV